MTEIHLRSDTEITTGSSLDNLLLSNDREEIILINKTIQDGVEIKLKDAIIIDYKIITDKKIKYVLYKIKITNYNYDTLYCWKRYSDFEYLYKKLKKDKYYKDFLPKLPSKMFYGNFDENNIINRIYGLNNFLKLAALDNRLQWGIQINEDLSVFKRREKLKNKKLNDNKWI
jgi:PX domain-containing protein